MIRLSLPLLGMMFGLSAGPLAQAEDSTSTRPIIIGSMLEVPPYVFEHPSRGIDIDIVRTVFLRMGKEAVFLHVPTLRLERLLTSGRADAVSTNRADLKGCVPSQPFSYWHDAVMTRRGLPKIVTSMVDLAGLNVGTFPKAERVLGTELAPFIRYFGSYNYLISNDVLDLLARGRLDAYIGDRLMVEFNMKDRDWQGEVPYEIAFELPATPRILCFANKDMAARFDAALAELQAEGGDRKISELYLGPPPTAEAPAENAEPAAP